MSINSIEYAITVTGSSSNAQASTCGTYLDQVWPKIGRELLDLVIAFNQGSDHQSKQIKIWLNSALNFDQDT